MVTIRMGFTPDPDDAFAAYALAHGKVPTPGFDFTFETRHIEDLNELVRRGHLDVAAISSAFYPFVRDRYHVLRAGASVGRGYGPVLVARRKLALAEFDGRTVAVPGSTTTGTSLLRLFLPRAVPRPMRFDCIRDAVVAGEVDAGVMIHEELLNFDDSKLRRVLCLGEHWLRETGLPLVVGLNVIRAELDPALAEAFATSLRASIEYARAHPEEAFDWARGFERSSSEARSWKFTTMFANEDTVELPPDCEDGLDTLFATLAQRGLTPEVGEVRFVGAAAVHPEAARIGAAAASGRASA